MKEGLFPKDDPCLRKATPETVKSLTLADVKDYYRKVFRPDLTTIVVIGRTTPEAAAQVIEQVLRRLEGGGTEARGPPARRCLRTSPRSWPCRTPGGCRTSRSRCPDAADLTRSNPDYYALQLGNHVLGGGFYASRLFQDLREDSGLVYNVSSEFDVKRTRGRLRGANTPAIPRTSPRHATIVVQNLAQCRRSRSPTATCKGPGPCRCDEIPLSESSVDDIAQGFIHRVDLDLPLDEPTRPPVST